MSKQVMEQALEALENSDKLIDQLLPGVKHLALQDYAFLNTTLIRNKEAIASLKEAIKQQYFPLGYCCYGGIKPKEQCGSCHAWKEVKQHELTDTYTAYGSSSIHYVEVLVSAKPLEWAETTPPGQWDDNLYGFSIILEQDLDSSLQYHANWGEGPEATFATLEAAQQWCQEQADALIHNWAVVKLVAK